MITRLHRPFVEGVRSEMLSVRIFLGPVHIETLIDLFAVRQVRKYSSKRQSSGRSTWENFSRSDSLRFLAGLLVLRPVQSLASTQPRQAVLNLFALPTACQCRALPRPCTCRTTRIS